MKKKILSVVFVLIIIGCLSGCNQNQLNVKNRNVIVEYGNKISLEAADYLNNKESILSEVKVTSNADEKEEYPSVGTYTITLAYKKQKETVNVSVVDTTAPKFIDFQDVTETYQNSKIDFDAMWKAEDMSEVKISCDDERVDYTVSGNYTATVTATDKYGNETAKIITIKVLPVTVTLSVKSAKIHVGEKMQLEAFVNIPDVQVTFTSSDNTVATVDNNGLVKGVTPGNATITAEYNNTKESCDIIIQEVDKKKNHTTSKNNTTNNQNIANNNTTINSGNSGNITNNNSNAQTTTQIITPKTSKEAFDLINAERLKLGLEPAVWDAECERIALIRAQEVAELGNVNANNAHDGFYKFQAENRKLGECVAWGYDSASGAVNGWMNSDGHRDILMDAEYTKLAIVRCGNRWVAVNSR